MQLMQRQTRVSIVGEDFHINGEPTYAGRTWRGHRIEGLLMNSRMVQAVFDDLNPETRHMWDYPDGPWDADRNTDAFIDAMPAWRDHGLLGIAFNLQGGSPQGYSKGQPWHNSAFDEAGGLRDAYMQRTRRVLDRADELGMVAILGLFYFGQDQRLADEAAVVAGVDHVTDWLLREGYTNVLVEVNNECEVEVYDHAILKPDRVHELIVRVRERSRGALLVGTSYAGIIGVGPNVAAESDFILLHGNGVHEPDGIGRMVRETRAVAGYRGQPILFNEDDHFDFDQPDNNMVAAIGEHTSWGYFDYRLKGETAFEEGYQSMPCDWGINSPRKRGFFGLLKEATGA